MRASSASSYFPNKEPVSEWLIVHMLLLVGFRIIRLIMRQCIHKVFQLNAVIRSQFRFERMGQSSPQAAPPAFAAVMHVCAPASQFTGQVHAHPFGRAHDAQHLPFGQHLAAAHTSALGHMLHTLDRFLLHLRFIPLLQNGGGINFLPFLAASFVAAFVLLAANDCAKVFVKF